MTSFCSQACIICDIDGFTGVNGNPTSNWDEPQGFCAPTPNNIRWIGFLAGSTNLSLEIAVSNCTNNTPFPGQGLQFGIYEVIDCVIGNTVAVSNCEDRVLPGTSATLTNTQPLVVGQYYYLVIDGWRDDVCDYAVSVTNGSTQVPPVTQGGGITGPVTACPNQPITYSTSAVPNAPNHYWYLDGNLLGSGLNYGITFPGPGTYEVCVEASNTCSTAPQECLTVVVADIPETIIPAVICGSECFDYLGTQLCNPGSFSYNFTSAAGCDSLVTINITQLPSVTAQLDTNACAGQTVQIGGNPYGVGSYSVTLPGQNGDCDTTLTLNVTELPAPITTLQETICDGDSYTLGTTVLTTAGNYTEVFQSAAGCDSTVNLALQVEVPPVTNLVETLCFGESITVGGTTYSSSGSYTEVLTTANGCDSTVNLTLTVLPELTSTIDTTVCDAEVVIVDGTPFSSSGTYQVVTPSVDGCDSTITLNLTVRPPITETLTEQVCAGQSYTLGTQVITTSGSYSETFTAANGCDSVVTLTLSVLTEIITNLNETICDGQTFTFDGNPLGTAGNYSATYTSSGGCDSTVNLALTVAPNPTTALNETICDGQSVTVGTQTYDQTGTYTVVLSSAAGCDSTVTLDLTVQTAITTALVEAICEGDSFTVGATDYTVQGNYTQVLTSAAGCDSTVTLDLTVNPNVTEQITAQICDGDFYNLGGQGFNTSGQYSVTLQTSEGCDSILNLDLTVVQTITATVNATICPGDTYFFNGSTYSTAGNYPFQTTSAAGCDSVVTLVLTEEQPVVTNLVEAVCDGETVEVGGQTFGTAGTYAVVLTAANGCDSTVNLQLIVNQPQSVQLQEEICEGGRYVIDGVVLNQPGVYNFTLATVAGCDSMVEVTLSVADSYFENYSATICPGTTYSFAGQVFTSGGNYVIPLTSVAGCDSILVLDIFEEALIEETVAATICDGQFYDFNGLQLFNAGQYFETFVTAQGCDSLVTLDLAVVTGIADSLDVDLCFGESYNFDGSTLTSSGTYSATYTSVGGCDSTVTLILEIAADPSTQLVERICAGESVQVGPQTFSSTGTYTVSLVTPAGCDSTITLDLTVSGGDTTNLTESICAGGTVTVGNQSFTTSGLYTVDLQTAAGCDSTVVLDLDVASVVSLSQNESLCDGESVTVRGTVYASAGTYTLNLPGVGGACDTTLTLQVDVGQASTTNLTESICAGETFPFDGTDLDASGSYNAVLTGANGCDSTVTLLLTVGSPIETNLTERICEGTSYDFGGTPLTTAGTYSQTLVAADGCDSVVTLTLLVDPSPTSNISAAICSGDSYTVGTTSFSESGNYTVVLSTSTGCDSTVILDLQVDDTVLLSESAAICAGEAVTVRGVNYDAAGTYSIAAPGANGECDTTITLTVVVSDPSTQTVAATICDGEVYDFGGQQLSVAGNYRDTLQTTAGCDSILSLTLSVLDATSTLDEQSICEGDTYRFDGRDYGVAGTYTATFQASNGCDSTVTLELEVLDVVNELLNPSICTGDVYRAGGMDFDATGTYTLNLTSSSGCDSVLVLMLNVVDSIVVQDSASLCAGQTLQFGSQTIATAGTYVDRRLSAAGCDSVTYLNVEVVDTLRTSLAESICEGERFAFAGSDLTDAGTYTDLLTSAGGCDSLVTLELTVNSTDEEQLAVTLCAGDSYLFAGQTYDETGTYSATFSNESGCDSLVELTLTVVDVLTAAIQVDLCQGQTFTFDGAVLTASGTYVERGQSTAGCDSVTTLQLTVSDTLRETIVVEACAGETVDFGGVGYGASGTYRQVLPSSQGCDSVATLELTVLDPIASALDVDLCAGDVYRANGREFTETGVYSLVYAAVSGCDSTVILDLTFTPCGSMLVGTTSPVQCFGEDNGAAFLTLSGFSLPLTLSYDCPAPRGQGDTLITSVPSGDVLRFGNLPAGTCSFSVVDADGVAAQVDLSIEQPTAPLSGVLEVSEVNGGYAVACVGDETATALVLMSGGTMPYSYQWTNGATQSSTEGLGAGRIGVNVTDERGCPWDDAVTLREPDPLEFGVEPTPIPCEADVLEGELGIDEPSGGVGPYTLLLDDVVITDQSMLEGLSPGDYTVSLVDANGCSTSATASLEVPEEPKLEVTAIDEILAGDTVALTLSSTLALDSILWTAQPAGYMSCTDCPRPRVAPAVTTRYTVYAETPAGCVATEELVLLVRREDGVYAPTAFSPNGDATNDAFTLYAQDEATHILELRVFDRWGEQMFVALDLPPGQPRLGWRGDFRGEPMNPAVYVWWARVQFRDGREEVLRGDLTLMR